MNDLAVIAAQEWARNNTDAAKMVKLLEFAPDCPPQLLEDARKVKEASDEAMRGLVELRLGVV